MTSLLSLNTSRIWFGEEGCYEETQDDRQLYDQAWLLSEISRSTRDACQQTKQGAAAGEQPVEEEGDGGRPEAVVEPAGQAVAQQSDKGGHLKHRRSC